SVGPSNSPHPWAHAYSLPERFTPATRSGVPEPVTSCLPDTAMVGPGGAAGADGKPSNVCENAQAGSDTPEHVFDVHCVGEGQGASRLADQNASRPSALLLAKATSLAASAVVNTSWLSSLIPIIGVTPTMAQSCASVLPGYR